MKANSNYRFVEYKTPVSDKVISAIVSLSVHALFLGFLFYEGQGQNQAEEELVSVQWVALTALGEVQKPQEMPKIIAPVAEVEQEEAVSISRVVKEETPPPKKEEKITEKTEQKIEGKKPEKKPTPPRKVKVNDLFDSSSDPRADNGPKKGDPRGSREGTNSAWNEGTEMSLYVSKLSNLVKRFFKIPNSISESQRKQLKGKIHIKLNANGFLISNMMWIEKSGNSYFDQAISKTMEDIKTQQIKLPLPSQENLKKMVLGSGLTFTLSGDE
jgi:outer membrane biosynthesis protein TonB